MANEHERPQLWQNTNERPVMGSTWSPLSLIFIGDLTFSYTVRTLVAESLTSERVTVISLSDVTLSRPH